MWYTYSMRTEIEYYDNYNNNDLKDLNIIDRYLKETRKTYKAEKSQ